MSDTPKSVVFPMIIVMILLVAPVFVYVFLRLNASRLKDR